MSKCIYYSLIWNSVKDYDVKVTETEIISKKFLIDRVHLRKMNIDLLIYGKIKYNYTPMNDLSNKYIIKSSPLIKSNLQKAIRIGDTEKALLSAYNLIITNFMEFIRRIIIISIEDVSFLDNTPFLVWCMLSCTNFQINNEMIQYLLTTVYQLSVSKKWLNRNKIDIMPQYDINDILKFSLLIRSEYGGLKGDMEMINYFCSNDITNKMIIKVPRKKLTVNRLLYKRDILMQSIDFHISSKLIPYISENTTIKDHEFIKKLIWFNNSAYNVRKNNINFEKDKWEIIAPFVHSFQREFKIR